MALIFCDGAVSFPDQRLTWGGLIIKDHNSYDKGFSRPLAFTSPLVAELWAVYHGARLAIAKGHTNLVFVLDSSQAFSMQSHKVYADKYKKLIDSIFELLECVIC